MRKSTTEQPVQPVVEAPQQEEEKEIIFGTPEAEAYEKQFWDQVNGSSPVPATPEGMNPNMEFMQTKWTPEQGTKLKAWMAEHNVTKKEEMSAPLVRHFLNRSTHSAILKNMAVMMTRMPVVGSG